MSREKTNSQFGVFSFFTGAGFLGLGFEDTGVKTMMANEVIFLSAKQEGVVLTMMKEGV